MARDNCGGPVVKEWDEHFLRDDQPIRGEESFSLFFDGTKEHYGRVKIFTGPKAWALVEAEKEVEAYYEEDE